MVILKKDNEDEIFDSCAFSCFDVGLVGYSYCLLVDFWKSRGIADRQIEIRRFRAKSQG